MNRLLPGGNYGWPLYSLGIDYDGTPVEYGKDLGITFELSDIEQPVVDLTPSPAVSSFIITTVSVRCYQVRRNRDPRGVSEPVG